MTKVFLSHSSLDNAAAIQLKDWLERNSFDVFYDYDSDVGIQVGEDWQRRLFSEIKTCQALVILQTENWLASKWCFAEFILACNVGKKIFPVIAAHASEAANCLIAPEIQCLDLRRNHDAGLAQLARQLHQIGLLAQQGFDWDRKRSPYPGLHAFQEEDAAIYFGRDNETIDVIERLRRIRSNGGHRLLVILGSSGSGKSSLLRAGVIPRLKKFNQEWIALPPFRPEGSPCLKLAMTLAKAMNRDKSWREIHEDLIAADRSNSLSGCITQIVAEIRIASGATEGQILLSIDQAEELFSGRDKEDSNRFLRILRVLLDGAQPMITLMTIRSDYLPSLQETEEQINGFEIVPFGPLPNARIEQIIRGPASVAGVEIEDEMVHQAIEDAVTEDALPLLAYVLEQIYQRTPQGERLSLQSYQQLGTKDDDATKASPIENAVRQAADRALNGSSEEAKQALREAFIPDMVRFNDRQEYVRQPAVWNKLPQQAWPLLEALVKERVLFSRHDEKSNNRIVEVAHEALLRKWPLLVKWLNEEKDFVSWHQRLELEVQDWNRAVTSQDRDGILLSGAKLSHARTWLEERPRLKPELKVFIQASINQSEAIERRQGRTKRIVKTVIAFLGVFTFVGAVVSWQKSREAEAALLEERIATHKIQLKSDPLESLIHGLAAAKELLENDRKTVQVNNRGRALELSITLAEATAANWAASESIRTNQGMVLALAETAQGELLSGGEDGTLKRLSDGDTPKQVLETKGGKIWSLALADNGEIVTSRENGKLELWKDQQLIKEISAGDQRINALIVLRNGDLLSGGEDGAIKRWRDWKVIETIPAGHPVRSLLALSNGDILSGGADGLIKRWRHGKLLGNPIKSHRSEVWGLVERSNGEIVSGGQDGLLKRWRNSTEVGLIKTGQSGVMSLIGLRNGDLISGGQDGTIRRWRQAKPAGVLPATRQGEFTHLGELENGEVISGGKEGVLQRWKEGQAQGQPIPTHEGEILSMAVLRDEVFTGGSDGTVRRWRSQQPVDSIPTGEAKVLGLLALSNSDLISLGEDPKGVNTLRRWSGRNLQGEPKATDQSQTHILSVLENGNLVTASYDGSVRIWRKDMSADDPVTPDQLMDGKNLVTLLPLDSSTILATYGDGTLVIWQMEGDKVIRAENVGTSPTRVLRLARLGPSELVSAGEDGTLRIWNVNGQRLMARDPSPTDLGSISSLLVLRNGGVVAGGSETIGFFSLPAIVAVACEQLRGYPFSSGDPASQRAGDLCGIGQLTLWNRLMETAAEPIRWVHRLGRPVTQAGGSTVDHQRVKRHWGEELLRRPS
jgi:WD40 repeat protein